MCACHPESGSGRTRDLATAIFAYSKRKSKGFAGLPLRFPDNRNDLTPRGLFRAQSGIRAHAQLREPRFRARFAAQQRAKNRSQKSERNAENTRILQRKDRGMLNQMTRRAYDSRRIDLHDARADDDQRRAKRSDPSPSPATAPVVLKRFQKSESTITGRLAEAATAKASPTRNATFASLPSRIATPIATAPTTKRGDARDAHFLARPALRPVVNDRGVEIVRERGRALIVRPATTARMVAKAIAAMKAKKMSPAERLGEQRRAHVIAAADRRSGRAQRSSRRRSRGTSS